MSSSEVFLVTGATGYIGGRLVPALLESDTKTGKARTVRVVVRDPGKVRDQPWAPKVEVYRGDFSDPGSIGAAFDGVDVAYYLVHSLVASQRFDEVDRRAATAFAAAAKAAGVRRIVYLGGLVPPGPPGAGGDGESSSLSLHLRSRAEVGQILRASGVSTVELRAAIILGSGSASFEMLRYLTERLPVMVTPKWVSNRVQPIAVRDVLRYLVLAADFPEGTNRSFDIGGPDVLTYKEMMLRYAAVAGLRRRVILAVPVLSPRLSSLWVGLVTPVPSAIARPLVESLRNEVVCSEDDIAELVSPPEGGLIRFEEAVQLSLARVRHADVATSWSSASPPGAPSDPLPTDPAWSGGSLYVDRRETRVAASADAVWDVIEGIGGANGWYSVPLAWELRGWVDRLFGGVGLRRGRRDPKRLRVGDALDFWRVEELDRGRLLRLRAEMKLPGLAWLELSVEPLGDDTCTYRQRALFLPKGLLGQAYWWSIAPFHGVVFAGMARNIAAAALPGDRSVGS